MNETEQAATTKRIEELLNAMCVPARLRDDARQEAWLAVCEGLTPRAGIARIVRDENTYARGLSHRGRKAYPAQIAFSQRDGEENQDPDNQQW